MILRDIKLRIRSVRKTQQITRAMKMVAAVKFRHAQARLLNGRPYAARIQELTAHALAQCNPADEPHPLLRRRLCRRLMLVVVASDKGLCGSFNNNVFRAVQRHFKELGAAPAETRPEVSLLLIGRKIHDVFKRLQSPPGLSCSIERYIPQAEADYTAIGRDLMAQFNAGRRDQVDAFYTEFKSALHNRVIHEPLLPLTVVPADAGSPAPLSTLMEPPLADLLTDLLPRFLLSRIRQALMESEASEQGTRMNMMDQATKNAEDLIAQLMLDFNKARQWSITRELADITTGAEAMA